MRTFEESGYRASVCFSRSLSRRGGAMVLGPKRFHVELTGHGIVRLSSRELSTEEDAETAASFAVAAAALARNTR